MLAKVEIGLSYVDAHLHLADPMFKGHVEEAIDDAKENNVSCLLSNATDYNTSLETIALAKHHSPQVFAAIGVHPWTASNTTSYELDKFEKLVDENKECVKAIGEIGLDGKYTQDELAKTRQREVFRFFLELAAQKKLPVVIHSRQAVNEVLGILPDFDLRKVLLHWYDGPIEALPSIRSRGYLISFGPALLYSRRIARIAANADLGMILTETDAPVKYPGPFEGRKTQPSFVVEVARKLADINKVNIEAVRNSVWNNFDEFTD